MTNKCIEVLNKWYPEIIGAIFTIFTNYVLWLCDIKVSVSSLSKMTESSIVILSTLLGLLLAAFAIFTTIDSVHQAAKSNTLINKYLKNLYFSFKCSAGVMVVGLFAAITIQLVITLSPEGKGFESNYADSVNSWCLGFVIGTLVSSLLNVLSTLTTIQDLRA